MRIALTTEGTYPFSRGGVGTWVDQVIAGLPEHEFDITALTASRAPSPAYDYDLHRNITSVRSVTCWGAVPRWRRVPSAVQSRFEQAWEVICRSSFMPASVATEAEVQAWSTLTSPSIGRRIHQLVNSSAAVAILRSEHAKVRSLLPDSGRVPGLHLYVKAAQFVSRLILPIGATVPDVDLLHATSNGPSMLPALEAHARGVPVVMSEHGVYYRERLLAHRKVDWSTVERQVVTSLTRSMVRVGYSIANLIAPCTNYNQRWERRLGADEARIRVLHNGVNPSIFALTDPPSEPTMAFVGRIDPLKDLETLVSAYRHVIDQVPGVQLRVFGPVPKMNSAYFEAVRSRCEALGVSEGVRFEGPISEPWRGYQAGSVVMMSSISEGFPYSALEAMSCGRPVVATDVGGVREAVGPAGRIVPARDPRSLADAAIELLRSPDLARNLGLQGRRRVEVRFTLADMLDNLRSIYQEVVGPQIPGHDSVIRLPGASMEEENEMTSIRTPEGAAA